MIEEQGSERIVPGAEPSMEPSAGFALEREVEGERVELRRGLAAIVRGEQVSVTQGGAGFVLADDNVSLEKGGARTIVAGENLSISQGGAAMIVVGGDAEITQGGAGTLVTFGDVDVTQGGAVLLVAGSARIGTGSTVGLAISPRLELEPGVRVLAGPRELAAAVVAGVLTVLALVLVGRR